MGLHFRNPFLRKKKEQPRPSDSLEGETESTQDTQSTQGTQITQSNRSAQNTQSASNTRVPKSSQPSVTSNPEAEALVETLDISSSPEAQPLEKGPQSSIWSDAYTRLKKEDEKLVTRYNAVLGALVQGETSTEVTAQQPPSEEAKPTQMLLMDKAVKAGLGRTDKESKAKGRIDELTASSGHPLWRLLSSGPASAQRGGVEYMTSRIDWYYYLSESVLAGGKAPLGLRKGLRKKLIGLYKVLLSFLMKSICLYHQNRLLITLRDFLKYDDWEKQVKSIKDQEAAVERDLDQNNKKRVLKLIASIAASTESSVKWVISSRNDFSLSIVERKLRSTPELLHLSLKKSR
ncbi:hypothetical protein QQZ08_004463 [Neonectria magnoliae]|uniref:NWD NACHT-NTPase N-terminal domain-containing protein n=1 Tax=Neonectria magnoliae TaxID=2732573 RepID=A0ABR1I6C1_9HYPO